MVWPIPDRSAVLSVDGKTSLELFGTVLSGIRHDPFTNLGIWDFVERAHNNDAIHHEWMYYSNKIIIMHQINTVYT